MKIALNLVIFSSIFFSTTSLALPQGGRSISSTATPEVVEQVLAALKPMVAEMIEQQSKTPTSVSDYGETDPQAVALQEKGSVENQELPLQEPSTANQVQSADVATAEQFGCTGEGSTPPSNSDIPKGCSTEEWKVIQEGFADDPIPTSEDGCTVWFDEYATCQDFCDAVLVDSRASDLLSERPVEDKQLVGTCNTETKRCACTFPSDGESFIKWLQERRGKSRQGGAPAS